MASRFLHDINLTGALEANGQPGTSGQILSSTATGVTWIDATGFSADSAEHVQVLVKNTSGSQILKGTPVYVTGETGNSGKIEIAPADASDVDKMPVLGLLKETLNNNGEGYCVTGGLLEGLATATIDGVSSTANDTVYVKAGGGLTLTKPTGTNFIQNVAKVARVHASNGSLLVSSILRYNDVPTPLYVDHDNQRLGIGTASPSSTLTISQTNDSGIKLIGYDDRDDASASMYIDSSGHFRINNTNGSGSGYMIVEAENYLNLRASSFVYFTSNVRVYDSNQFGFGSSNDLVIQHDGSHSYISQNGTGNLYIQQNTNDADMVFQCDNGSGGTSIYMMLDGSESRISTKVNNRFDDNVKLELGTSGDLDLLHDGSNSYIHHNGAGSLYMKADTGDINIINYTNDRDITLQSDDGSGGVTEYFRVDGSSQAIVISKATQHGDNVKGYYGAANDLQIYHNGTDSVIDNTAGDFYISQKAADKDLIFRADDGAGGFTPYLTLDGSDSKVKALKQLEVTGGIELTNGNLNMPDNSIIRLGSSTDLQIYHNGTNSNIINYAGDLVIRNGATDKDIILQSDDGSGGETAYLTLDGSETKTIVSQTMEFQDNVKLAVGNSEDLIIDHNATDSRVINYTGDLRIVNSANDKDITLESDDGSGGITPYLTLDGSAKTANIDVPIKVNDQIVLDSKQAYTLPAQGTRMRILQITNHTLCRLYLESSENSYHQPIVLDIFYKAQSTGSKPQIVRSENYQWHTHSNDIIFTSDGASSPGADTYIYAEKVVYSTGRSVNIRKIEVFDGDLTVLDGSTTDTNGGTDETVESTFSEITSTGKITAEEVGIGTTSPTYILDVETSDDIIARFSSTDNKGAIAVKDNDTTAYISAENSRIGFGTSPALSTQNITMLTGNNFVGIGVISPGEKLEVDGSVKIQNNDAIKSENVAGSTRSLISLGSDNILRIKGNDSEGSSNVISMIAGGNVGIGNTSPAYKLDVSSGSAVGARISTSGFSNLDLVSSRTSGNLGGIRFKQDVDAYQTGEFLGLHGGGFEWKTSNGTASPTSRMILNTSGNVGIGTTSPGSKLHVSESASASTADLLYLENTGSGGNEGVSIVFNPMFSATSMIASNREGFGSDATNLSFHTSVVNGDPPIERMRIASGGNVGIATTSPTEKLHVEGRIRLGSTPVICSHDNVGIDIDQNNNSGSNYFRVTRDGETTELFRVQENGNVGIGTTSPSTRLHVSSVSSNDQLTLERTGAFTGKYTLHTANNNFYIGNNVAGSIPLAILNNGNVGIGTTSPAYKLDVRNSSTLFYGQTNLTDSTSIFRIRANGGSSEILEIKANGNIGIGTASPNSKLEVNVGTDQNVAINSHNSIARISSYNDAFTASEPLIINGSDLRFDISGSEKMRIASGGNVGIGTSSPSSTLDVNGAITLSGSSNEIIKSNGSIRLNIDSDNNQGDRIFIVSHHSNTELFRVDEGGHGEFQGNATVNGSIELGHASDTTIARSAAGKVTIEGAPIQTTQMSMSHHNFYFNTSSTTIDYFVPFNSLTESSNPTVSNYYGRMVAPYDGRIVKAVINTTQAIGTACSAQFWVATSSGTFAPSPAETVSNINLNTANAAATATFSGTSTAEFSEGDVVGLSIQKSGTTSIAYIQVTIVWEYTV